MTYHTPSDYVKKLITWYNQNARDLPWRAKGENHPDPYQVWVSEIMLQQTTVAAVMDYFERFMKRFPSLEALAHASQDEVLTLWQGLGYYARGRNLHKAARHLVANEMISLPSQEDALAHLPGIGPYTAAAIASMAFNAPTLPVDGNVARVFSRVFRIETPLPHLLRDVRLRVKAFTGLGPHHGDIAQALMDLGSGICTPSSPSCHVCPWQSMCESFVHNQSTSYPKRASKKTLPHKQGVAFVIQNPEGTLLLQKRASSGLLAGMMGVPTTPWEEDVCDTTPPCQGQWAVLDKKVTHVFTHFRLTLEVWSATLECPQHLEGIWVMPQDLPRYALSTLMKKVLRAADVL